jgi:PAS domain-containing protein
MRRVDGSERFRADDLQTLAADRPLEFDAYATIGVDRHLYLSINFPLYDDNGLTFAVGGVSTDITQRKQSEQAGGEAKPGLMKPISA